MYESGLWLKKRGGDTKNGHENPKWSFQDRIMEIQQQQRTQKDTIVHIKLNIQ